MSAVVYDLAMRRNAELVAVLRELLEHAESGDLVDFGGEAGDSLGNRYLVRCGAYKDDGKLSKMAFRLQMQAAYRNDGTG